MSDFLSNYGSAIIKKESTKGVAVTPNIAIPLMGETFSTDPHLGEAKLIVGNGFARYKNFMGQRSHTGELTVMAEPNTAGYLADMVLTKGSTTGSGPYTHPFTKSTTTNPNSYTVQIQRGDVPYRYVGVEGRGMQLQFQDGLGQLVVPVTARAVFSVAEITNVNSTVLTLDTTYSAAPTTGLVASDNVTIYKQAGGSVNTTVSSLDTDGTKVTVASATGITAGDLITLRAISPSLTLVNELLWPRSFYQFAADASTALTATHTPIEPDSGSWNIIHSLKTDEGKGRSGSFDRANLVRTIADVELNTKQTFGTNSVERDFLQMKKRAIVCRHYSGTSYEVRLTINNAKMLTKPNPLVIDDVIYDDITWRPEYDTSDSAMFSLTVINNISTI